MTDYKATPEDWELQSQWASDCADARCLLELRARVEALEAAKRQALKVLDVSDLPQWTPEQAQQIADLLTLNSSATLTSYNYPAKPDSSLVKRVALAISGIEYGSERDEEAANWASEARAAIREVAAWMRKNDCGYNAVRWLDQEAE